MEEDEQEDDTFSEEVVLCPEGTTIYPPDENNEIAIAFPTWEDAVIFYERLKAYSRGELKLLQTS